MNLLQIIFLALLGLSAGMIVAGGVFSFIVELGVISDLQIVPIPAIIF